MLAAWLRLGFHDQVGLRSRQLEGVTVPNRALGIQVQGVPCKVPCLARVQDALWAWLGAAGEGFTHLQRQQQSQHGQDQSESSIKGDKAEPPCTQAAFLQPSRPWDTHTHVPRVCRELAVPGCWLNCLNSENLCPSELLLEEEELTRPQGTAHSSAPGSQAPRKVWESPLLHGRIG